ncbi:MAG: phospholipase D family protein [SAR324 cluster bacterium]|nr:phospholipase D family protein [SAR324 cluster bacterium]
MPLAIIFRKNLDQNIFRDLIINILDSTQSDEALICSGFFQENFKKSDYQVSLEKGFATVCASRKINLTTIGIHNNTWKQSYQNFKVNMLASNVNIKCFYKNGLAWHAKVFIALKNSIPVFGIIGSSNFTSKAFSTAGKFNNECDVVLWTDEMSVDYIVQNSLPRDNFGSIIRAPYDPAQNGNLTIETRLLSLQSEILNENLVLL